VLYLRLVTEVFLINSAEKLSPISSFEELGRLERRNRMLGRLAIGPEQRLLNNDALADVFLLLENDSEASTNIEAQIKKNYLSDMSERSGTETQERHFYLQVDYKVRGYDLVADEVSSYRGMMEGGLQAAWEDAKNDSDLIYALKRSQVQVKHIDMLLDWYRSGDQRAVRISSLCPEETEISGKAAKKANFKPDRLMASEWIFERTADGMRMHAFSQDNLTLQHLQAINKILGIKDKVAESTLQEMDKLVITPFSSGLKLRDAQQQALDDILSNKNGGKYHYGIRVSDYDARSSNEMVLSKPEAEELWVNSVKAVSESLRRRAVSEELAGIASVLRKDFAAGTVPIELGLNKNHSISIDQARNFMDYLRKRAIPQYIFGDLGVIQTSESYSSGSDYGGIASAGSYAVSKGISHEGDCQTSGTAATANTPAAQAAAKAQIESSLQVYASKEEFTSAWCPNCLPSPIPGEKVRAWKKGDHIGCYDCGREQSVCPDPITGKTKIFNYGKSIDRYSKRTPQGLFDIIAVELARYRQEYEEREKIQRQKEEIMRQQKQEMNSN